MPNAISYIRFSSGRQGKGSSTERQEDLVNEWMSKHPDYKLSTLSAKDLGRSAFSGEHLKYGLGDIVRAIEERKIEKGDVLLVEALDRLGRLQPMEMFDLINKVVGHGVKIITLQDQAEYSTEDLNSPSGTIFLLVGKIQQAHDYSKNLSARISAAYDLKRQKARDGEKIKLATPCWLNSDGTLKQAEADAVRACIDLYLRGRGTRRVLLELREIHPSLRNVHPSTVKRWFKSRALIGEWENKGDVIEGVFTPLIDDSTFYDLQRQLSSRTKVMSPEKKYKLSGLVECAVCGSKYYYRRKKHRDHIIIYANCSTYLKRGLPFCSNNRTWPYEVLTFVFQETHSHWVNRIAAGNVEDKNIIELRTQKDKKAECEKTIAALLELLSDYPNQQQTKTKLKDLYERQDKIEKRIAQLEGALRDDAITLELHKLRSLIETEAIRDDPTYMRELLEKAGYKILIDCDVASVDAIEFPVYENSKFRPREESALKRTKQKKLVVSYELLRRSTKYNCYIVRKVDRSFFIGESDQCVGSGIDESGNISHFAISRTGVIGSGETEDGLIERLSQSLDIVGNEVVESLPRPSCDDEAEEDDEDGDEYHHSNLV